jgi:hypothetical protein
MNEEATAQVGPQHQQKSAKRNFSVCLSHYGHFFWLGIMKSIMGDIYIENKVILMDVLEQFYIFDNTKLRNQISKKCKSNPNILFDSVSQNTTVADSNS